MSRSRPRTGQIRTPAPAPARARPGPGLLLAALALAVAVVLVGLDLRAGSTTPREGGAGEIWWTQVDRIDEAYRDQQARRPAPPDADGA